jgi:neural Wiskott-Aldrich syndrome protein
LVAAPTPAPKAAPPVQKTIKKTTKGKGKQRQLLDDLERDLLGLDEDAEGDIDISMERINPKPIVRKEEEEEEEELPGPPKLTHPIPPKPQLPQKPRQVKPIPKQRIESKVTNTTSQPPRQKLSPPPAPPNTLTPIPPPKTRPAQKKEQARQREPVQQTGLISKKESVQKTESTQKKEPIKKKEPVQKEKKAKSLPNTISAPSKSAPYADEEVIEFGRPAKRPRQSTPQRAMLPPSPPATVTLSLPGGSSSFAPPPPPPGSHNSRGTGSSSRDLPPPPAAPAVLSLPTSVPASPPMMGQYSDEEEDWDEVSTANLASASLAPSKSNSNVDDNPGTYDLALEQDIFGDVFEEVDGDDASIAQQPYGDGGGDGEEEEIDMNAFEQELNEHMEVVDDDSDDDVFGNVELEEPDLQGGGGGTRQPISLNRLVSGGVGVEMSEEEYSSSDDSDDD